MPIYEYECTEHGRFELIMNLSDSDKQFVNCPETYCAGMCERVWSLTSMQPDNMWSGINTEQGYFTSKKQHLRNLKEKNLERVDRSIMEEVKKKSKNKVSEAMKKNEKKLEKFLEKELAPV